MRNGTFCINLQQDRLPLNLNLELISCACECMEESHGFACSHAQVCSDCVQGYHSGLSSFKGDPDFCSRIHSLDVMEITQKDYNHIRVSSIPTQVMMFGGHGEDVLRHKCQLPHGCPWWTVANVVDLISCSDEDILVIWELSIC